MSPRWRSLFPLLQVGRRGEREYSGAIDRRVSEELIASVFHASNLQRAWSAPTAEVDKKAPLDQRQTLYWSS